MNRRDMLKLAGATVATGAISSYGSSTKDMDSKAHENPIISSAARLPRNGNGPRVIVVGGGWSGLSVAKRLKQFVPQADVVLVEQRTTFVSCPISNLWLVGEVDLEFLTHSFLDAANNNNYTFFHSSVYDVDRKKQIVYTNRGYISYDYLVLAPGIDYDYSRWTHGDEELEYKLRTQYPAGFRTHSEHATIKDKIENFDEGNFILTCPGGNYRCLPAPYERTCLIADYFKKNGIKGKVILMDENVDITIKKKGFHSAFNEMYKDYVTYMPDTKIEKFDLKNKTVTTEFGEVVKFADAAFYPHVRGNKLLEIAGVAKDAINKAEAHIDPFTYQVIGDPHVYCSGDARPMGFSKSGNTSNSEGHVVARSIADHILGKKFKWSSPHTTCYSAVATKPLRSIFVNADYKWNKANGSFGFYNAATMENWHGKSGTNAGRGTKEWASGMYRDMFS